MGIDKEGSRNGGGYVGGFFQLFDWTAKSRKKLFSSKSDFPECSKQGKRSDGNLPMTRVHLMNEDEIGAGMSFKGSSDYSCASSVTDDDMYGARAPSVVARLMGLDSLPTSSEPYSTPLFDTQSLRDAHFRNRKLNYHHDQKELVYPGDMFNKMEVHARNFVETKPQKIVSKPIEKFQTESLPRKAAKTIPITQHKLLSPIKSPGFIPTKNAAHIMEAAARIIEPGPQVITQAKMPLVGSSSVPVKVRDFKKKLEAAQKMPQVGSSSVLKVRDLKGKAEAAHKASRFTEMTQKPFESKAVKNLTGHSLNKSWNGSTDTPSTRTSDTEEIYSALKSERKSISLAIQAKVNVQKRGGLTSSSSRSLLRPKDQSEVKSNQPLEGQPSTHKSLHKKSSMHNASGVLRHNNQKQNCITDKEKLPLKPMASNSHSRKVLPGESTFGRHKTSGKTVGNSKTGSRKLSLGTADSEKGGPYSSTENPRKKRSIDRDFHLKKNEVVDSVSIQRNCKEDHLVTERNFSWVEDSKKKGMDIVSFTFTAPLTQSMETSAWTTGQNSSISRDNQGKRLLLDSKSMKLSSLGYNAIGGDALSMLLEQKLRELSNAVESSFKKSQSSGLASTCTLFSQDPGHTPNAVSSIAGLHNKLGTCYSSDLSATDLQLSKLEHKFQGVDAMDECSSSHLDARQPSPVSILEPSFSTESCNSLDSTDSFSIEGSKRCSSVQDREVLQLSSLKKLRTLEADTELSDSASSISSGTVAKRSKNIFMSDPMIPVNWELEYVKLILCNVELMFKDFALGRAREIINPHLFDRLENQRGGFGSDGNESRLERKVLFDSVSQCLDLRCRRYVGVGYRMWDKGMKILRRNEWLAGEVYKEISAWSSIGDCMVDELVDKDMSSQYGNWLDFEVDAFELGADIEVQILNALVDEVVAETLQF